MRIETDAGIVGWGESDCSPLVGLVCYVTPPSHTCIHNIASVVVGATIGSPADIVALHEKVLGTDLLDIQQAEHAYSGCDIALWDALGKYTGRPVYELLHEYFEPAGSPCVPLGKVRTPALQAPPICSDTDVALRARSHTLRFCSRPLRRRHAKSLSAAGPKATRWSSSDGVPLGSTHWKQTLRW